MKLNMADTSYTKSKQHFHSLNDIIILIVFTETFISFKGCVSVGENVINLDNVSFVQFNALNIDCSRSTTITATNGKISEMYC